jgi:AcrR family transcriptional regulator
MAWDTEQTKRRLLDAAAAEFGAHGFSGARIDRIGAGAGVNKERIYSYFGSKKGLFEAAITRQLISGLDETPITGTGPEAVATFAGDYFDASVRNPQLARLTSWEGLERSEPVGVEQRSVRASNKAVAIQRALPGLGVESAQDLLLTIVTLSHAWTVGRNLGLIITGDPDDHARRRVHLMASIRAIAEDLAPARPLPVAHAV